MALTIELPPEIEARYAAEAAARGIALDAYLRERLVEVAPVPPRNLTGPERAAAIREWAKSHRPTPPLSDEAISRETIYGKRG